MWSRTRKRGSTGVAALALLLAVLSVLVAGCGGDGGDDGAGGEPEPSATEETEQADETSTGEAEDDQGAAPGATDEQAVEEAVVAYYNALADQDGAAACDLLAPTALEEVSRLSGGDGSCEETLEQLLAGVSETDLDKARDVDVTDVQVRGATATATVEGATASIPLRESGGQWLIARFEAAGS